MVSALFKSVVLMMYRNDIRILLVSLQQNVDRQNGKRVHSFVAMNRIGNITSQICFVIICVCEVALIIGPIALNAIHYIRGTLDDAMWDHPISMV